MTPPHTSSSNSLLPSLKNLFNRPNQSDYEQLVYNIRLITAIACAFFNILGFLTSPNYSGPLALFTVGLQVLYLFAQSSHHCCFGSNPENMLAFPMMTMACFVVYSLQFYPISLNILFVIVSVQIMLRQKEYGENFFSYDPTIHIFLKLAGHAWISASICISIMINIFQIFNRRIWRAYASTKQKLVERNQELYEANQKMEHMLQNLKEVNQRLEVSNKSLSEALKSQDLFIACVSHELRTPLNAMIGNIELLQVEAVDPAKKKMLKTCQICGEILLVMINNILDVAKINASTLEISVSMMNMSHFIEKIWNVSCQRILQKDLYGKLFISRDVPLWLKGDFHRLIQIIINLIGNAAKFTTKGGIRVLISWEKAPKISTGNEHDSFVSQDYSEFRSFERTFETLAEYSHINEVLKSSIVSQQMNKLNQENWIVFSETDDNFTSLQEKLSIPFSMQGTLKIQVIDTGCGIPPEAHCRIFEPFVQADSSITRKYGGTGLGLYIIKELLGKMNGTITVSSEVNKGAKFTIRIPLSTISPQEAAHSKESIYSPSRIFSKSIGISPVLIVDDSHYNQNVLKTYLESMRIPSETADNGLEALDKVKGHPFGYYSMIMMDIQMPVMDGITSCNKIRQYEKGRKYADSIPIIIITANCTSAEQQECMAPDSEIKAAYFFRKPFSYSDCKLSVEAILTQRKMKKTKALVVDDDAFNRELLQAQIKRLGLECDTCRNGLEALQRLKDDPCIGIILTDFEMPVMSGIETARKIRRELKLEEICIVGVTGNVEEELNRQSLMSGMNKVLTKPVSLNQISSLLKEYKLI